MWGTRSSVAKGLRNVLSYLETLKDVLGERKIACMFSFPGLGGVAAHVS